MLLNIGGQKSHKSLMLQDLCKENKITTLCPSSHVSLLLQRFDVGCVSSWMQAYGKKVWGLEESHIEHIDKKA